MNRRLGRLVFVLAVLAIVTPASAAELLIYDSTFDFDESEHGFHYFQPPPNGPSDWLSPDDYYNGSWELRFEILSQATSRTSNLQVCIWVDGGNETCAPHTPLDGPGDVATVSTSPSSWWTMSGPVDFAHPELWDRLGMPLWNDEPCVVSDWATEFCWDDRFDYFPMQIRLTVVAVSVGSTFSGWETYLGGTPTVAITEPADGAHFAPGSTIHVEATAAAAYAAIAQVDFLQGATPIGSATVAPYAVDWANVPEGTFTLIARATDTLDGTANAQVTVTVGEGGSGTGGGSSGGGGTGGSTPPTASKADNGSDCSCRTAGHRSTWPTALLWLAPWVVVLRPRRPSPVPQR